MLHFKSTTLLYITGIFFSLLVQLHNSELIFSKERWLIKTLIFVDMYFEGEKKDMKQQVDYSN